MTSLPFHSATELVAQIKSKKVSAEELLDLYLARTEKYHPKLNAIIAMDIPTARRRAKAADAAIAKREDWGPLHGLPIVIKDSFDLAGLPATWGVPELKDHRPANNAVTVQRLLDAGAIAFGKTNVSAYLIGWHTTNEIYGTTNNPWDLERSPGGSSGGSGAALAAGLAALDVGVDHAGGIRNVAHYCGIYAHKSTYGVTNWEGHVLPGIPYKPDLAVCGPLARSAADLKAGLLAIAGPIPQDAVAWKLNLPAPRTSKISELRVAVMLDDPNFPVDPEVQERVQAAADFLAKHGAKVSDRARPAIDTAATFRIFGGLLMAGVSGRKHDEVFWNAISHLRKSFGNEAEGEGQLIDRVFSHGDWIQLDSARQLLRRAWRGFFQDYDVLLCPAAPTVAVPHDPKHAWHERKIVVKGKPASPVNPVFWAAFTGVAYLPSTVAPAGLTKSGLPSGVQIVGPEYGDLTCIEVARLLEQGFQAFVPPKGFA